MDGSSAIYKYIKCNHDAKIYLGLKLVHGLVANLLEHLNRRGGAKSWQIVDELELGGEEQRIRKLAGSGQGWSNL
jgi:hypothetical protein